MEPMLKDTDTVLHFASWQHIAYGNLLRKVPSIGRWMVDLVRWFVPLPGREMRRKAIAQPLLEKLADIYFCVEEPPELLIISHSMGTVITYQALQYWIMTEGRMGWDKWLLTIGSPLAWVPKCFLGMGKATPPGVVRWANMFHHKDPVAGTQALSWLFHDHTLADEFRPQGIYYERPDRQVVDWPIYHSEASPHDSNGYLHSRSVQNLVYAFAHGEPWPFDAIRRRHNGG